MRLIQLLEQQVSIYIGAVDDGYLMGAKISWPTDGSTPHPNELVTHDSLGYWGKRWRFPTTSGVVFWWETPDADDQARVDEFLAKRGFTGLRHRVMANDQYQIISFSHGGGPPPKGMEPRPKSKIRMPAYA